MLVQTSLNNDNDNYNYDNMSNDNNCCLTVCSLRRFVLLGPFETCLSTNYRGRQRGWGRSSPSSLSGLAKKAQPPRERSLSRQTVFCRAATGWEPISFSSARGGGFDRLTMAGERQKKKQLYYSRRRQPERIRIQSPHEPLPPCTRMGRRAGHTHKLRHST